MAFDIVIWHHLLPLLLTTYSYLKSLKPVTSNQTGNYLLYVKPDSVINHGYEICCIYQNLRYILMMIEYFELDEYT